MKHPLISCTVKELQNEYANAQHPHVRNRRSGKYLRKICMPAVQIDLRAKRLEAHPFQS